ncbi:MAG: hypothetical protein ISS69_06680 [Phycisphaerae bacterium]|nr:hypothetical protein [Phycisphaerae bacterium]
MITAKCPSCQVTVRGPDHVAGKKVKCGKCQTIFQFPQPAPPAGSPPAAQQAAPQPAPQVAPQAPGRPQSPSKAPARKVRRAARAKGGKKKLILFGSIGAAAIVLVLLLVVFVPKMFGGSSSAMIGQYASADTFAVASIDIQNIIKSDLYEKLGLKELVDKGMSDAPIKLKPEDVSAFVVLLDKPLPGKKFRPEPTIVVRTMKDTPFKEMLVPQLAVNVKEHEGVEYLALGGESMLVKTDTATICMLQRGGIDAMKKLISRLKGGATEALNESLRSAMDRVSGEASFVAMYMPDALKGEIAKGPPIISSIKGGGLGFSIASGVELKVAAAFSEDKDAETALKLVEGAKAMGLLTIKQMAADAEDNDVKSVMEVVAKTLDAVKIRQDGSELLADASLAGGDIMLVKDKFPKVMAAMMSGGPSTTGGKPAGDPFSALMGIFGK